MRNIAWMDRAKCVALIPRCGEPNCSHGKGCSRTRATDVVNAMFVPDDRSDDASLKAIGICMGCPVFKECLEWAAEHPASWREGVYGGLRASERAWDTASDLAVLPNLEEATSRAETRQECAAREHPSPEGACLCGLVKSGDQGVLGAA